MAKVGLHSVVVQKVTEAADGRWQFRAAVLNYNNNFVLGLEIK